MSSVIVSGVRRIVIERENGETLVIESPEGVAFEVRDESNPTGRVSIDKPPTFKT